MYPCLDEPLLVDLAGDSTEQPVKFLTAIDSTRMSASASRSGGPTISGGCHLGRDTGAALEDGDFRIERVERFVFSVSALDPPKSHILGTARRI